MCTTTAGHILTCPYSHEEADTCMLLHVAHAAQHDHNQIHICTGVTDVVVLAVMVVQAIPAKDEVWLAFGTGKSFRYLVAHKIAACLGAEKSRALPMFHALTECDTSSVFVGHGNKSAWVAWNSLPELTEALLRLACVPTELPKYSTHA